MRKKMKFFFCFLGISISIGCVKLSLLKRENLPSVVNVLTNSPKILYITMRDSCKLNLLHRDRDQ